MSGADFAAFQRACFQCREPWFQRWVWLEKSALVFIICTPVGDVRIPRHCICYDCGSTGVTRRDEKLAVYCHCGFASGAVLQDFGPNDIERAAAARYFKRA